MAYQPQYYSGSYYPQYSNGATPDMLNQYKTQYQQPIPIQQPMMQQPFQQMPMQPTQMSGTSDMMIWVLSEVEAQSYPVAPNNSVILWDKNKDTVYIKSVNMQGVPSMRILDYAERTADNAPKTPVEHECKCGSKFASKEEFKALQAELDAFREEFEEYKAKPKSKQTKKVIEEATDGEQFV